MKLITGCACPFIVYNLINIKKDYNEHQLFSTREEIMDAFIRKAAEIGNYKGEFKSDSFLNISNRD